MINVKDHAAHRLMAREIIMIMIIMIIMIIIIIIIIIMIITVIIIIVIIIDNNNSKWSRQAKKWIRREVDLVRGFPFVSEVFFFRGSHE